MDWEKKEEQGCWDGKRCVEEYDLLLLKKRKKNLQLGYKVYWIEKNLGEEKKAWWRKEKIPFHRN